MTDSPKEAPEKTINISDADAKEVEEIIDTLSKEHSMERPNSANNKSLPDKDKDNSEISR